jgi:short chain dehydrogenase
VGECTMEFENRLIVITGGAGGIARATAELLLAHGAELLLIDPSASALAAAAAELVPSARVRTAVSASNPRMPAVKRSPGSSGRSMPWSTSPASSGRMRWTERTARCGTRPWPPT